MSGYLASLISRTFEPQVAVQPHLAPLFGPSGPEPGWSTARLPIEEESVVEVVPRTARSLIRLDTPADTPAAVGARKATPTVLPAAPAEPAPARTSDGDTLPDHAAHRLSSPDPKPHSERPPAPRLDESTGQVRSPSKIELPALAAKPVTTKPVAGTEPATEIREVVELRVIDAAPRAKPRAEMQKLDVVPAREAPLEPTVRNVVERYYSRSQPQAAEDHDAPRPPAAGQYRQAVTGFPASPAAAERAPAPSPRIIPARAERNAAAPFQPAPAAEPSIQVTIGRIEVRAAAPAQPQKPARTPSAVLGLEEYLRQRSGGRRP
jgi:hypothetical protein